MSKHLIDASLDTQDEPNGRLSSKDVGPDYLLDFEQYADEDSDDADLDSNDRMTSW